MKYKMSKLWDCKYTIEELLEGNEDEFCLLNINYDRHWSDDNIGTMVILLKKKDTNGYLEIGMFEDGLVYNGGVTRASIDDCIETTMKKAYLLLEDYVKLYMDRLNLESQMLKMGIEESCPNIVFKNGYELEKTSNKKLHADKIEDKLKYIKLIKREVERSVQQYKKNNNDCYGKIKTEFKLKMFLADKNNINIPINETFIRGINHSLCIEILNEVAEEYLIDIEYLKDKDLYYNEDMTKLLIKSKGTNEVIREIDTKSVINVSKSYYSIEFNINGEEDKNEK